MANTTKKKKSQKKYNYVSRSMILPDGTRKVYRGKSVFEVEQKMRRAETMLHSGVDLSQGDTFGAFAQTWYDIYKKPYLRPKSQSALKYILNDYILPALGGYYPADITPIQIQALMASLSRKSNSLQGKVLIALRSLFRAAEENGLVDKSPVSSTLKAGGRKTEEKIALTPAQSRCLLDRVTNPRSHTFTLIALETGMRKGEILGLLWKNVDFENHLIRVRTNAITVDGEVQVSSDLKTKAAKRDIPMPRELEEWLSIQYRIRRSKYVLCMRDREPMTDSAYKSMWTQIARELPQVHVTAHILRHTYITRLFEAGLDIKEVQYLAGHSSVDMTLRVYTHYDRASRQEETCQKVWRAFEP